MLAFRAEILEKYSLMKFVVQKFVCDVESQCDKVWVVLSCGNDAVLFVSNDRDTAEKVRAAYAEIGLAYTDPIDYWVREVGVISEHTREYLEAVDRAHRMYGQPAVDADAQERERESAARLERLLNPVPNGAVSRFLEENERVTIFEGVINVSNE